jgi:hypothetical protein
MINHSFSNDNKSLAQNADFPDQDSQYTPTPGYYEQTPLSEYESCPSPGRCPLDGPDSLSSPQPDTPKLLQLCEWEASNPDSELPGHVVQYTIDWKVKVNNRSVSALTRNRPLIAYVEGGGILQCQDDFPDAVREELFLEEQQRLESSQHKSNKNQGPGNYPPTNINFMGAQPCLQSSATNPNVVSVLSGDGGRFGMVESA